MIVVLRFRAPVRPWHRTLAESLASTGFTPWLDPVARRERSAIDVVHAIERHLYRQPYPVAAPAVPARHGRPDVALILDGEEADFDDVSDCLVLEPFFDGRSGETALAHAILGRRVPTITIRRRSNDGILAIGLPAIEDPANLTRSMNQVFARLGILVAQAVRGFDRQGGTGRPAATVEPAGARDDEGGTGGVAACAFVARGLAGKLAHRFGHACGRPEHWQIGYRADDGDVSKRTLSGQPFTMIPDDGARFYADPFPFEHEGHRYIFFEDFPYATGKGIIGVVEIDASGIASPPRPVLERDVHLSYPLVMRHGDDIVMLPEMSGARRVQLFRADPFPDTWVPAEILVDDVVAADATPVWHDGRYWLFATLAGDGGSSWDQLGLFHAPDLVGPWTPHQANPVLIDASAARPAGAMWHEDGVLMRVAQDCRAGYGAGLAICRVDRLDEDGFSQTVVAQLAPPAGLGARGVHTLNRAGGLEVIDMKLPHPR